MDVPPATLNQFDLTSRVVVENFTPVFTGNYSNVYQGTFEGELVAVKVIKSTGDPRSMRRKILRERTIWASLDHQNIHPFYGFANDHLFAPFGAFVSPWYARGDANKYLNEHGTQMSEGERIKLWSGIVDGVAHLHQNNPVIVHGDLKPGNILIDDSGQPRICDFGLSQIFLNETDTGLTTTSEHAGTVRYLAPELVASEFTVCPTTLSDVYAVGCLGLEILYLQRPYSHRINNLQGHVIRDLRKGIPPAADPPDSWSQAWLLLRSCWNREPELRPSGIIVAQSLKLMLEAPLGAMILTRDYRDKDTHDDAEEVHLEAPAEQTSLRGTDHLDTINEAVSLARTYCDQGRWGDAEKLQSEVLEKRRRIQGVDHLDTIRAASTLAITYSNQERWKDTERLQSEVLEKRRRIHGVDHLDTIRAASTLAITYSNQERWKDAERLRLEVLEKRRRIHGVDHLDTIHASSTLAITYSNQERWKDAERLRLEVLEKRRRIQGVDHLDTINAAFHLANTYFNQERWKDAEELHLEVLEKRTSIQGEDHLDTINAAFHLANTYFNQGRRWDAEKLELEVLEKRTRILGADHLDTIRAAANLAATFCKQRRWRAAEKLQSGVLEKRKRIRGEWHQDTIRAAASLADIERHLESQERGCIVV